MSLKISEVTSSSLIEVRVVCESQTSEGEDCHFPSFSSPYFFKSRQSCKQWLRYYPFPLQVPHWSGDTHRNNEAAIRVKRIEFVAGCEFSLSINSSYNSVDFRRDEILEASLFTNRIRNISKETDKEKETKRKRRRRQTMTKHLNEDNRMIHSLKFSKKKMRSGGPNLKLSHMQTIRF